MGLTEQPPRWSLTDLLPDPVQVSLEGALARLEQAVCEFEALRRPNAEAIAAMALENYVEMRDVVRDPKFLLQKQLGFLLEERHPRVFVPRYSMVMFHHLPYADARSRGAIQQRILDSLTQGVSDVKQVDLTKADALVRAELGGMERVH